MTIDYSDLRPEYWEAIKYDMPSVARIKDKEAQLEEIEKRLTWRGKMLAQQGIAMTAIHIMVALSIDDETYYRWMDCRGQRRENGKVVEYDVLSDEKATDEYKLIYKRRRDIIKKCLLQAHEYLLCNVQGKDNRTNGGAIWTAEKIFKDGKDEQALMQAISLEDIISVAKIIKAAKE